MKTKLIALLLSFTPSLAIAATDHAIPVNSRGYTILKSEDDQDAKGKMEFFETGEGIRVSYRLSGLEQNTPYNFKISDQKDCDKVDPNAAPQTLPVVTADENGEAKGKFVIKEDLSLIRDNAISGKAIALYSAAEGLEANSIASCGKIKVSHN